MGATKLQDVSGSVTIATASPTANYTVTLPNSNGGLLSSGDFLGTNVSLSTNGYQKLPSGLIIQWMTWVDTGSWTTRNYPIAFPNACLSASFSNHHPSADGTAGGIVTISGTAPSLGTSQMRTGLNGGNTWKVHAILIGY